MLTITVPVRRVAAGTLVLAALPLAEAAAQRVMTRTDLGVLLGATATTEDFSNVPVSAGAAIDLATPTLDATTVLSGAAGRIVPGVRFTSSTLFANGVGYFGMASTTIEGGSPTLTVTFLTPVTAFGLDAMNFAGFASTGSMRVFGMNGLLGEVLGGSLPGAPAFTFLGWQAAGGITRVELTNESPAQFWSPVIDNVTFGTLATTVPEPTTVVLLGAGLLAAGVAARRRRG